jgi:hypothetical protein
VTVKSLPLISGMWVSKGGSGSNGSTAHPYPSNKLE